MIIYSVGDTVLFSELYDDGDLVELLLDGCVCVEDDTTQVFYDFDVLSEDMSLDTEVLIVDRRVYEK